MDSKHNVLVIGGGAREHALAWKLRRSPMLGQLYVAPGNGGTQAIAANVPIKPGEIGRLLDFARSHNVDLTVVGPDDALALGIVDAFRDVGLGIYGPTRAAAQIETSKCFSKGLMADLDIPSPRYETFTDLRSARRYVDFQSFPLVIKASGPAFGRGTYVAYDLPEARVALDRVMGEKIFGDAGNCVVIEEHLYGREASIHAFCDGRRVAAFPPAQDHKRVGTGDMGPNTGGMGAYAPVPWLGPGVLDDVMAHVVDPVLAALKAKSSPFEGTLYPGIMVDSAGVEVLEFNARFGDPETQAFMPLLDCDLLGILASCANGELVPEEIKWNSKTALTVVLASAGYPGRYETGLPITGVEAAEALPDVVVFHAGTRRAGDSLVTSGGRVLDVTAVGDDLAQAQQKAYEAVKVIHFEGMQYRTDIGDKGLPLLRN